MLYLTEEKKDKQYWNIPIANTTCILLGTGTSITQVAKCILASAGVLVGFSGGGATPLIAAIDANAFLNHGNYLAYGLAATMLWVLARTIHESV